ncbi:chromatin associated protein KTI12 [Xylariomycetidae sp. FL2044]|nr:chromatin associated protein KTI12 [Xylariomycetidae sp. FL2044]
MPLIIITGLPTSGKSTRAKQLHAYLTARIAEQHHPGPPKYRLHLISDQTLSIPRSVYDLSAVPAHARSANASEKDARAALYAAVKRVLSDRDIVILDGLNYIKGWRYQLFCEAKAVRTPSCVVQVGCSRERSQEVNEARLSERSKSRSSRSRSGDGDTEGAEKVDDDVNAKKDEGGDGEGEGQGEDENEAPYEPANWENLVFRYEEPNAMTRWDSPLFTLIWEDDEAQTRQAFDAIWDAVAGEARKVIRPNQATVQRSRDTGGDHLYQLDRETQEVVRRILERQGEGEGGGGDEVRIPRLGGAGNAGGNNDDDNDADILVVELPAGKKVGLPQLQRLRRAFMGLNRGGIGLENVGNLGPGRIREIFVRYLNDAFEKDG